MNNVTGRRIEIGIVEFDLKSMVPRWPNKKTVRKLLVYGGYPINIFFIFKFMSKPITNIT